MGTASATTVFMSLTGTVEASTAAGINAGDPYSILLTFDTGDPAHPSIPDFYSFGPSSSLEITVGGCALSASGVGSPANPNGVTAIHNQVLNGQLAGDFFAANGNSGLGSTCGQFSPTQVGIQLVGPPGLLLDGGVPTSFDLNQLVQPSFSGYTTGTTVFLNPGPTFFVGNFNSIDIAVAPEPGTVGLMISSLLVLGIAERARRRAP